MASPNQHEAHRFSPPQRLPPARAAIVAAALALLGFWVILHIHEFTADPDDRIRLILGLVLSPIILFRRRKPEDFTNPSQIGIGLAAALGCLLALSGIVFHVRQCEWLGLLLLVFACLQWALPPNFSRDVTLSLLLFYWVHPLPGQILGPLMLWMQRLSVQGSEWLLHCANIPVWCDGYILRTGLGNFEVPASCSGMRTATTVLLCAVGSGILFRFRWRELVLIAVTGVAQVLALNILRISALVFLSHRRLMDSSGTYFHDTAGFFLLGAIILVQFEMAIWSRIRQWYRTELAVRHRSLWRRVVGKVLRQRIPLRVVISGYVILAIVLSAVGFAIYERRPSHRARLIAGVVGGLIAADLPKAQKAIEAAVAIEPDNSEYRLTYAQILLMRHEAPALLRELDKIPPADQQEFFAFLKISGLIISGRIQEADAYADRLPPRFRGDPRIAMAAAELAAMKNDADAAARYTLRAAVSPQMMRHVRLLFPYLAAHEKWRCIVDADRREPYDNLSELHIAITAALVVNDLNRASTLLKDNRALWFGDPFFLKPLLTVAFWSPVGPWTDVFAQSFGASLQHLSADDLCDYLDPSFQLGRADLAWLAYARLHKLDAEHPGLYAARALLANQWFTFRKKHVGLPARSSTETIDLRPLFCLVRGMRPFRGLLDTLPLAQEYLAGKPESRETLAAKCLAELDKRQAAGELSAALSNVRVDALVLSKRLSEAQALLDRLATAHPERKKEILLRQTGLYEQQGDWQRAYEAGREWRLLSPYPPLSVKLAIINSLMNLDLGLYAMDVAQEALAENPGDPEVRSTVAAIWEAFGYDEEALFVLRGVPGSETAPLFLRLLDKTGRRSASRENQVGLKLPNTATAKRGARFPAVPPAESTLVMPPHPPPSDTEAVRLIVQLTASAKADTSPFVRGLHRATLAWYEAKGSGPSSGMQPWLDIGRDDREKAVALHKLALLLMQNRDRGEVERVVEEATRLMPQSAILWRMRIALSRGDARVIQKARQQCPGDSDIWLADLVVGVRDRRPSFDPLTMISEAADGDRYSPGTIVRAGNFLLRNGRGKAADAAARRAILRDTDFLPAYALGLNCGLAQRNFEWALECAKKASLMAPDPSPYVRAIVRLTMDQNKDDIGLIPDLVMLKERFPAESEWTERLAKLYFDKGDMDSVVRLLSPAVENPKQRTRSSVLILAAEAARKTGRKEEAIRFLLTAHRAYPEDAQVLNNLVYTLAQTPAHLSEAQGLLATLLKTGSSAATYDTAATVCFRAGDHGQAATYIEKALALSDPRSPDWREINVNAAEMQYGMGHYDRAQDILRVLRKDVRSGNFGDARTEALQEKLDSRRRAKARGDG